MRAAVDRRGIALFQTRIGVNLASLRAYSFVSFGLFILFYGSRSLFPIDTSATSSKTLRENNAPNFDILILTTEDDAQLKAANLCGTIHSALSYGGASEVILLWSLLSNDYTPRLPNVIDFFMRSCLGHRNSHVKNIIHYKLEKSGFEYKCEQNQFAKENKIVCSVSNHSGISYTSAMQFAGSRQLPVVLLESDVSLVSEFKSTIQELLKCDGNSNMATSLYNPLPVKSRNWIHRRKLKTVEFHAPQDSCSTLTVASLSFGTQGILFTQKFLRDFSAHVKRMRSEFKILLHPDQELKRFCKDNSVLKRSSCKRVSVSILQHTGLRSTLFGSSTSNPRFHQAGDIPQRKTEIYKLSGGLRDRIEEIRDN